MSLINSIYDAPIISTKDDCVSIVVISINGHSFAGQSICHPNDAPYDSKKVGHNIALSRARINAMKYYKKKLQEEATWKFRVYKETSNSAVLKNYIHAKKRLESITAAIKKEKKELNDYLEAQVKVINSIKQYREKVEDN